MKTLPADIQRELQPKLKVIWWGRRAVFEVVKEISNGIFWIYIIAGVGYNAAYYTDLDQSYTYWIAVAIAALMAFQHAFLEIMAWKNEIYVVARDEVNGNGRVYKFWGWLTKRHIDKSISADWPTILPENAWYYRLWGYCTGEKMSKIKLSHPDHVYLEGRKISPDFERAIKFIRGYKAPKEDLPPTSLSALAYLHEAKVGGLIKDTAFIENAAKKLISSQIYGE